MIAMPLNLLRRFVVAVVVAWSHAWPSAMPTSSWGTRMHEDAIAGHTSEWRLTVPQHSWLIQTNPGGSQQRRGGLDPPAPPADGGGSRRHSSPLYLLDALHSHLLWCLTGGSWQSHRSRQIYSGLPGGSEAACMSWGLRGQTFSRCLTIREQGEVTLGKTIWRRNVKHDWFLPVLSVFADLETAFQGAVWETCSQRGGVLSGQAERGRTLWDHCCSGPAPIHNKEKKEEAVHLFTIVGPTTAVCCASVPPELQVDREWWI